MLKYFDQRLSSDYILILAQAVDVAAEYIPYVPYINNIFNLL
jgi:hypothetical protein